ncbi:ATP-binding protein [Actinokineospora sp. HUAS TT18]|uniref:ATP-binding protein n=1 Tax=Actinokineospora sp. HUAS TT18 TaxID=3447451 RepID=UPI003F525B06
MSRSRISTTRAQFDRDRTPPARPRIITEGVEVTDDAVWVWTEVPAASSYLLEDDQLSAATWDTATAMAALLPAGAEYHLKVMWTVHGSEDYIRGWDQVHSVRAPGSADYIGLGAGRIDRNAADGHYRRRVVLLGVRWPDPDSDSTVERTWRRARLRGSTRLAHRDAHQRLAAARADIVRWLGQMERSALRATAAPAELIAWAYAREIRRSPLQIPHATTLSGPALVALMNGEMDPVQPGRTHVVVTDRDSGARRCLTILVPAVNGFPVSELEVPGGEWLEILTELPGVEASVRGVNHGHAGSIAVIDSGRKRTRSQTREAAGHGAQVPAEILDADDTLNQRRQEVTRRIDVLTVNHARWVVDAADPDELADRVAAVRQRYTGIVQLEVVPDLQDLLWQELLPGDRVRVHAFGQDQPMRTLAGSWFHGGSAIGDTTGPYIGANLGSTPGPVQAHIVSRADGDRARPTTISFTGMSGSGKSTAVMLATLGALAEGAWALLVDPKGDLAGVIDVARRLLGVDVQSVDALAESASGSMDPMRFGTTVDEAHTLTLDALLGALSSEDRRRGETLLETAVHQVLTSMPQEAWSAQAVISELLSTPESDTDFATARELGATLSLRSRQPQLRAVLGPAGDTTALMTGRGLVYLNLAGLDLPRHTTDPDRWTVSERCSIATFRMALSYALHQSRRVRELKKLVALTELHLITGYPEGRAFVEWQARTGRALQVWLLLDSQSARDLAGMTGLIEQLVMSFAFRATTRDEQDAQAVLLGRAEPGPRLRHMQSQLRTGQCVMRDRHGRLAPIEFDRLTQWIADALSTDAGEDHDPGGA